MKICDVVQSFTARSGGIRTYILARQRYFADHDCCEHVLVVPGARDSARQEGRTRIHEVASPFIPGYRPYRFNVRAGRVARILAAEMPDVIELANPFLLSGVAFRHRKRHAACAVVGFYHADFPTAYVAEPVASVWGRRAGRACGGLAEAYARRVYGRYDLTIAASPANIRRLGAMRIGNVAEIPLGVDLGAFDPARADPGALRDLFRPAAGSGPVLIYCGRLDREKQVEVLVRAHQSLPRAAGIRLLMIGEGPLRPAMEAQAAMEPRLVVLPFVTDRIRLATLLASSDLYVTAGPFETFGLSVLEAQACGLTVVGVDAGALPDRVPPGQGRLVPAGDACAMAAAIVSELARDRDERRRTARAWAEANGDWARILDMMLVTYSQLRPARRQA